MTDRKDHDGTLPSDLDSEFPIITVEPNEHPLPEMLDDPRTLDLDQYGPVTLQMLQRIAFADIGEYVKWGTRGVIAKPSDELTPLQRQLITEVSEDKDGNIRVKLCSKDQAIRLLAQISGLTAEPDSKNLGKGLDALMEALKLVDGQTRGLPPKTIDGEVTDD